MFCTKFRSLTSGRWPGWSAAAALVLCSSLAGCCDKCNLRGSNFSDDSLAAQGRQLRKPDKDEKPFAITTKGQQIEKDVGIGQ